MKYIVALVAGIVLAFSSSTLYAQSGSRQYYTFEKDSAAYIPLDTGTTTRVTDDKWVEDDVFHIPIGFSFYFLDHKLDSVGINQDNLFMPERNYYVTPFGNFLMWDRGNYDTTLSTGISPISYITTGALGSRILKIQWQNAGFFYDSTSFLNFQIWLYEGSNTIEVRYGKSHVNLKLSQVNQCGPFIGIGKVDTVVTDKEIYELDLRGKARNPETVLLNGTGKRCLDDAPSQGTIYRFLFHDPDRYPAQYNIYPNPTRGLLNIDLTDSLPALLTIWDMVGRTVFSGNVVYGEQLDISRERSGLYLAKIIQGTRVYSQKIILTR